MNSKVMCQAPQTIDDGVNSRPSAIEFEMAYQARVAIDRIKFAIKHTEQFVPCTGQTREASLQLLDALRRLETVERRFQKRSLTGDEWGQIETPRANSAVNGTSRRSSHESPNGFEISVSAASGPITQQ
jgi:hypothetical protein